jgi:putative ABC transport system ATP-binding protein
MPAVLELRGVPKVYRNGPAEVHALRQAGLSVTAGAMVAVTGPGGSGKSTLLTIAGSIEDPTSGEVLAEGVPLSGWACACSATPDPGVPDPLTRPQPAR